MSLNELNFSVQILFKVIDKIANVEDEDPEYMMNLLEKELTSIKFEIFGKVKFQNKTKADKELSKL